MGFFIPSRDQRGLAAHQAAGDHRHRGIFGPLQWVDTQYIGTKYEICVYLPLLHTGQGWGQKTEMSLVVYFVYFEQRSLCAAKLGTMLQTPSISNFDHHLRFAFLANFWQVLKL